MGQRNMTNLILGPPGTGKTYTLMETLEKELEKLNINEIAYLSFTTNAIEEAIDRATIKFPAIPKKNFIYFKTLHALCFKLLKLNRNSVISWKLKEHFVQVMQTRGIEISLTYDEDKIDVKNIHLYLYHIAINQMKNLKEVMHLNNQETNLQEIEFVVACYEDFKAEHKVIDFNDMLIDLYESDIKPLKHIKTVFLDEAQDLTPLQWAIFDKLFCETQVKYIAGDDDQSIFEWSGVDIEKFLSVEYTNKKVLSQSYRIPKKVLNFSNKIIKNVGHRFEKEYHATPETGQVKRIFYIDELQQILLEDLKAGKTWFFLIRNKKFSEDIKEFLISLGVPFTLFGSKFIPAKDIKAINLWEKIRKTNKFTSKDQELLLSYVYKSVLTEKERPEWYKAFQKMKLETANYYRKILKNKFNIEQSKNVEITTIHRSKGREADTVVIIPDMAFTTFEGFENNADAEHRVFYVAATRTKEKLYYLEPTSKFYYQFKEVI
jgi:superfamily I DNA/RNA helicase